MPTYMHGIIWCTDPNLLDYMMTWNGDLMKDKRHREKKHWSKIEYQGTLGGPFSI